MIVFNTVTEPTEYVFAQPEVAVFLEDVSHGQGKLIICERAVTWIADDSTNGFTLTPRSIIFHHVLGHDNLDGFPHECLEMFITLEFCQLTLSSDPPQEPDSNGDEMKKDEIQLRFVPLDKSVLELAKSAVSELRKNWYNSNSNLKLASGDNVKRLMGDGEEEGEPVGDMASYGDMGEGFQEGEGSGWYGQETKPDEVELTPEGIANLQRMLGGGNIEQNGDHGMDG